MRHPLFLPCLLLSCAAAFAAPTDQYRCHRAASPPTIDGTLDDACWRDAQVALVRRSVTRDNPVAPPAAFRLMWDDAHLYFAARVRDLTPICRMTQRDAKVWTDDCFEIYFKPDDNPDRYYELDFNAAGVAWDSLWLPFGEGDRRTLPAWTAPSLQTATHRDGDVWTLEGRIAFADLHGDWPTPPAHGHAWRVGVNYLDQQPEAGREDVYVWQQAEAIADTAQFGTLAFIDNVGHARNLTAADVVRRWPGGESLHDHFDRVSVRSDSNAKWARDPDRARFRHGYGRLQVDGDVLEAAPVGSDESTHVTIEAWRSGRMIVMARHTDRGAQRLTRGAGDGVWLHVNDQPLRIADATWRGLVLPVQTGDKVELEFDPGPARSMSSDMFLMRVEIADAAEADAAWNVNGDGSRVQHVDTPYRPTGRAVRIDAAHRYAGMEQRIPHTPGAKLYKITGWVRTDLDEATFAHIGIDYLRADGGMERQATTRAPLDQHLRWGLINVTGRSPWKHYIAYAYDMPPETHTLRLWLGVNAWENPNASGAAWFNDVQVEAVEPDPQRDMRFAPTTWRGPAPQWTDAQRQRGFAVSAPSHLTYHLPDMPPQSPTDAPALRTIAIAGQPQAATVMVHAIRDLKNLTLHVGDLNGPATIKTDAIDVGVVRYHERHRGKMSYEYLRSPNHIEPAAPVGVDAGQTQQFWLTVDVPADAPPGRYSGEVRIDVAGDESVTVPWQFDLAAVKPQPVTGKWLGMYSYHFPHDTRETIARDMADMKAHGMTTTFAFLPYIQMPIEVGDGKPRIVWNEDNHLMATFELYKQTGFSQPMLLIEPSAIYDAAIEHGGPLGSDGFARVYRDLFEQLRAKQRGSDWPPFILAPYDEGYPYPFTDHRFDRTRVCGGILKDMGIPIATHSVNLPTDGGARFNQQFTAMMDMLLLTWCFPPITAGGAFDGYDSWPAYRDAMRGRGRKLLAYNVDVTGLHPEAMRFSYGLGLWLLDADGIIDWHYHESSRRSPYDIWRRQGYSNMSFIYPPRDGHAGGPTLGWEAVREGVTDLRLLQTLEPLMRDRPDVRAELEQWFVGVDFSRLNSTGALALPGHWQTEGHDEHDRPTVGGAYKIDNGLSLADYDALRRWLCHTIETLQGQN